MEIFLAGNFPALQNVDSERPIYNQIVNYGSNYKRLVSFFYLKEAMTALEIKKETLNGEERPKLIRRKKDGQTSEGLDERERDRRKNGIRVRKTLLLDPQHNISGKGYYMGGEQELNEEATFLDQQDGDRGSE
jgi:hypothetical protein